MNIVITGSLGNISKPLVSQLLGQGHKVTVVSSSAERKNEIKGLGAKPAIGKIEDVDFLTQTFKGHDAVYCMLPPFKFFENKNLDYKKKALHIANNYSQAIKQTGIKKVVHLSSVGAEKKKRNRAIGLSSYCGICFSTTSIRYCRYTYSTSFV